MKITYAWGVFFIRTDIIRVNIVWISIQKSLDCRANLLVLDFKNLRCSNKALRVSIREVFSACHIMRTYNRCKMK